MVVTDQVLFASLLGKKKKEEWKTTPLEELWLLLLLLAFSSLFCFKLGVLCLDMKSNPFWSLSSVFSCSSSRKNIQWKNIKRSILGGTRGVCGWLSSWGASLGEWKQARIYPVSGRNPVCTRPVGRHRFRWTHRQEWWFSGRSSVFPMWTFKGHIHPTFKVDEEGAGRRWS